MSIEKVVLITGANKGLGKEIARQLGKHGFTVVLGARDTKAGEAAASELVSEGLTAHALRLDVTDGQQVGEAAAWVSTTFGKLDVLINNAGISLDWDGTPNTPEKMRRTFDVNVVGPWVVTDAFTNLLERSDDARVINHSSILGSIASVDAMWKQMGAMCHEAYTASKAALDMLTVVTSHKLAAKKIAVTAAHPGWVKTDLGGPAAPLSVIDGAKTVVGLVTIERAKFPHASLIHKGEKLPW